MEGLRRQKKLAQNEREDGAIQDKKGMKERYPHG
jgi:hypothetical protein